MSKIYGVVLRLQEPEITARCYGKECGRGIFAALFDDDLGALVPCAQEECPHLEKQTDEPLWKDGEGRDVYLRRLTPLTANVELRAGRQFHRRNVPLERRVRQRFSESDMNEWQQEWQPTERDNRLHELATRYHTECEAYDQTVCTGPTGQDGIMPANPHEMALINRNAHAVLKSLEEEAQREGIGREELSRAISKWHGSLPNG